MALQEKTEHTTGSLEPDNGRFAPGVIRRARTADVLAMQRIVNRFADQGAMLHRSLSDLYENIRDYHVADESGIVVGCSALHVNWKDLAELRSLAVAEESQGRGYGRDLIERCVADAAAVGVQRVFALTYVPELFEKLGFERIDKALLPRKVWTECVFCPKFPVCAEVAVIYEPK